MDSFKPSKQWYFSLQEYYDSIGSELMGFSTEERPMHELTIGSGPISIAIFGAMHGNETTSVTIVSNLVARLKEASSNPDFPFTVHILPVVSPDAFVRHTRRDGRGMDLNRDFKAFQTVEAAKLIGWIKSIEPELCFNLHDQRTIFHVGGQSAAMSVLVPSADVERTVSKSRQWCMSQVMNGVANVNPAFTSHIGRYTDEFYPTAVGDYLMANGFKNILIESGAYPDDPFRNTSATMACDFIMGILEGWDVTHENGVEQYHALPANEKGQLEWVFTNVNYLGMRVDIALRLVKMVNGQQPMERWLVDDIGDLSHRPRLRSTDGTAVGIAIPVQIDAPVDDLWGNYSFTDGFLEVV